MAILVTTLVQLLTMHKPNVFFEGEEEEGEIVPLGGKRQHLLLPMINYYMIGSGQKCAELLV